MMNDENDMNLEKKPVRIIHTSDIHLGEWEVVKDEGVENRSRRALKALVDHSIQTEASLVIIAGDLFDHNRVDTEIVEFAIGELRKVPVPVLILPGNHDCLVSDSVYRRVCFSKLAPNVSLFTDPQGERFSFPDLDVSIWGKAITSHDGNFRPMAGIPPRGTERWQIAVAHGRYVNEWSDRIYSLQISKEEIAQSCQDYIALGHSSGYRCVCDAPVKAYYSGSASETGTIVIIDLLDESGARVECRPLTL